MKKLLGGVFNKQRSQQSLSAPSNCNTNPITTIKGVPLSPPQNGPGVTPYKTGPRSNWDTFFHSVRSSSSLSILTKPMSSTISPPSKLFSQNLEILLREIVNKIKFIISVVNQQGECDTDMLQLCGFISLAADKLLETGMSPIESLKYYFSSPAGLALCEQSGFLSLILDFVNKVRIYLLKMEYHRLEMGLVDASTLAPNGAETFERPVQFLMQCVHVITSDFELMEQFRCEIPNLIMLTAEVYPSSAMYLRDLASQALAIVSDKNFNAGLVWYLSDCNTIGQTVRMMKDCADAVIVTSDNVSLAIQSLLASTKSSTHKDTSSDPIAAAVGDALGLGPRVNKVEFPVESNETRDTSTTTSHEITINDMEKELNDAPTPYCLCEYDPLPGMKSLVYTLHKTCRFSLVLLGEFQSSGGYELLAHLIKKQSSDKQRTSTLIYLFTLLLPLGTGFSGVVGDDDHMATVITCGARNVGAFLAMRDVVLDCINEMTNVTSCVASGDKESISEQARLEDLLLQLLTTILQVYTSSYDSFLCLEQKCQTLAMIISRFPLLWFYDARVIVLRIVEYVCIAATPESALPTETLAVLCSQFIEFSAAETTDLVQMLQVCDNPGAPRHANNDDESPAQLLCECLIRILQNSSMEAYRVELNSFGLLERGVYALFVKVASTISTVSTLVRRQYLLGFASLLGKWASLTCLMIKSNERLCVEFREMQIDHSLYIIADGLLAEDMVQLPPPNHSSCATGFSIFSIFIELSMLSLSEREDEGSTNLLVLQTGIEGDLTKILELVQHTRDSWKRQQFVLEVVKNMLKGSEMMWRAWSNCHGHQIIISLLSSIEHIERGEENPNGDVKFCLMDSTLEILTLILDTQHGDPANLASFQDQIGYSTIASCILNSGVLQSSSSKLDLVLNRLFELITGQTLPRNKVRNAASVETLFCLLPVLPPHRGVKVIERLLSKILTNDDAHLSRKRQVQSLINAGIFKWFTTRNIVSLLLYNEETNRDINDASPSTLLQSMLVKLLLVLSAEELSTSHLREFLRVIANCIPKLLGNAFHPTYQRQSGYSESDDDGLCRREELGLWLLDKTLSGSTVPQALVGTSVRTRMTSGYVHVTNQNARLWPPSGGYSFACWARFPVVPLRKKMSIMTGQGTESPQCIEVDSRASKTDRVATPVVCVALCEGPIRIRLDGDEVMGKDVYGVLVGAELRLFASHESARLNANPIQTMVVTALSPFSSTSGEFIIWSHEKRYVICTESVDMWVRALQQLENISCRPMKNYSTTDEENAVFGSEEDSNMEESTVSSDQCEGLDGYVCLLSIYSLEASGCFTRIYFDQTNGCLRVDTGSVTSGPNMNPNSKRTTALFKNVNLALLRVPAATTDDEEVKFPIDGDGEKAAHWHHLAFTHRKAALGSSQLTLYIDGAEVATKKLSYPSAPSTPNTMQAFIGKDIQICGTYPALPWSVGPAWLVDDVLGSNAIASMFLLGPTFTGQFSGHAYRSIGDFPEAIASSQLYRATNRRVEIARLARRLQLPKLLRATRRQWLENGGESIDEPLFHEGSTGRGSESKKNKPSLLKRNDEFPAFVNLDCSMSVFGNEILEVFSSFRLSEDRILFSVNTKASACKTKRTLASSTQFVGTECYTPLDFAMALPSLGGVTQLFVPLLDNAWRAVDIQLVLKLLVRCMRRNPSSLAEFLEMNGYALIASVICQRIHLINTRVLHAVIKIAIAGSLTRKNQGYVPPLVVDSAALSQIVLCREVCKALPSPLQLELIGYLHALVDGEHNANAIFNARQLRRAGFVTWLLLYIGDICNTNVENESQGFTLDERLCMDHRSCFPTFTDADTTLTLHRLLALLSTFFRLENNLCDVQLLSEFILLSLSISNQPQQYHILERGSLFRVVLLQFVLHEVEKDSRDSRGMRNGAGGESGEQFATSIIESIFARASMITKRTQKKREGGLVEGALTALSSPTLNTPTPSSGSASNGDTITVSDGLDTTLLEVIRRTDSGQFSTLEALLATRILLTLAQTFSGFANYFFHNSFLFQKLKQALAVYSIDCNFYTPLLAYISNIPIKETLYNDSVAKASITTVPAEESTVNAPPHEQFALPTPPSVMVLTEKYCVDHVWELLGAMLLKNGSSSTKSNAVRSTRVTLLVVTQLAFQMDVSESFFTAVCKSHSTVLRIFARLLLSNSAAVREGGDSDQIDPIDAFNVQLPLSFLVSNTHPTAASTSSMSMLCTIRAVAYLDFLRILMSRCLFEKDDFALSQMLLLEGLDQEIRDDQPILSMEGQKCWLALLVHVVKSTNALGEHCSFFVIRNLCTLCVALARYLMDDHKHKVLSCEDSNCFGTEVLLFFLSITRICADTHVTHVIGADDQQYFYGAFVYCVQNILLSELCTSAHRGTSPSLRLLDSLVHSKNLFVQQTKVSGVIICGSINKEEGHETASSTSEKGMTNHSRSQGLSVQLTRIRSLSTHNHKEFGIGVESDRSFILSFAAELFRWLLEDTPYVQHAAIHLWQFLLQQRMGVLKEVLIIEPKVSLLQNLASTRKEAVDVYRGGFEQVLHLAPPPMSTTRDGTQKRNSTNENWLQFHLWLTEHHDLLHDLLITRTEPIFQHTMDVLLSCLCIRKVGMTTSGGSSRNTTNNEFTLIHVDFTNALADPIVALHATEDDITTAALSVALMAKYATRKTLLNLTIVEESAMEAMRDAQLRWRETSNRLHNTRAIWHMGDWLEAGGMDKIAPRDHDMETTSTSELFYLERSIFQQNNFKYRLDFTEGPQRLRLRLVRDYETLRSEEIGMEEERIESTTEQIAKRQSLIGLSCTDDANDAVRRKIDFHQAVDAFREYVYKTSTSLQSFDMSTEESKQEATERLHIEVLQTIARRISNRCVNALLISASEVMGTRQGLALAKLIFEEFLADSMHVEMINVSNDAVEDIGRQITAVDEDWGEKACGCMLSSTLFDVADAEAMRMTRVIAPTDSGTITSSNGATDTVESDEEEEDGLTTGRVDPSDSDSEPEEDTRTNSNNNENRMVTKESLSLSTMKETATKGKSLDEDKLVDNSLDYVYGGISRFLHREDYPPLRCYNAAYVAGMTKTMGVFLVCQHAIYFVSGYGKLYSDVEGSVPSSTPSISLVSPTVKSKKKAKDIIRNTFADIGLPFSSGKGMDNQLFTVVSTPSGPSVSIKRWSIKYMDIKQFYRIKYQLRPVGIEFFDIFGSTFFLQFESTMEREEIIKNLFQMPIIHSIFWNPVLRSSAFSLSVKRVRQGLTKRWLKGQISNFEYLMHLNTFAGRTFNDLTQYPVFPWVLADYQSEFLDLESDKTFRDLTKPMGALGESRAALFRERFAAMNYDGGGRNGRLPGPMDTPAFHYGTHYSCSAYVINYLIRMEPFSQLARELQGGSYDHADRLFRSIPASWDSASTENLQDVRELVPEFYFLPEFLYNSNGYDLGTTQSGEVVSHVKLPRWAHGDPREFIRLHRRALESKYVSEHLHHWIDLIFGCKQTGSAALEAQNVFMHLTYEGAVDIDAIEDPMMRNAILSQIENFGQTPSKLFNSAHPARKVPTLGIPVNAEGTTGTSALTITSPTSGLGHLYEGNTMSSIEAYVKWHTPLAPALVSIGKDYVFLKKQLAVKVFENGDAVGDVKIMSDKFQSRGIGCTCIPPRFTKYLDWGATCDDGTMKVRVHHSTTRHREANKVVVVIEGAHHSRVNCATYSDDGVILVTGGDDAVVNVLECSKGAHGQRLFRQIVKLVGHEDGVVSVDINKEFNLIASGSRDCCVILWDLRTRTFLRELTGHSAPVKYVCINSANGNVVTATTTELRIWSVNGDLLAATPIVIHGLSPITSAIATRCEMWQSGVVAVTGHSNGTVTLWGMSYPSDLEKDKQSRFETDLLSPRSASIQHQQMNTKVAVRIRGETIDQSKHSTAEYGTDAIPVKAVPSCQLFIMKLLLDHRVGVTALTLGADQRSLVSGDSDGNCIRWVDDSIATNMM